MDSLHSPRGSHASKTTPRDSQERKVPPVRASMDVKQTTRRGPPPRTRSTIAGGRSSPIAGGRMAQSFNESHHTTWTRPHAGAPHDFSGEHWGAPHGMRPIGALNARGLQRGASNAEPHGAGSVEQGSSALAQHAGLGEWARHAAAGSEDRGVHDLHDDAAMSGVGEPVNSDVAALCRAVLQAPSTGHDAQELARRLLDDVQAG